MLKGVFDPKTLLLIETSFEGYDGDNIEVHESYFEYLETGGRIAEKEKEEEKERIILTQNEVIACHNIDEHYRWATDEKLISIMQCIIDNNGEYIPEKVELVELYDIEEDN